MLIHDSCQSAIQSCVDTGTFAVARLYDNEKAKSVHMHDCYEICFSVSGGKQFVINGQVYEFEPGDIFFINPFDSHDWHKIDHMTHTCVAISICPEYLKRFSTEQTDLNYCFTYQGPAWGHKLNLTGDERRRFMYFIHKLSQERGFGQDVLDQAVFLELMTFLNHIVILRCVQEPDLDRAKTRSAPKPCAPKPRHSQIDEILDYIDEHLAENLSIPMLASHFYFSSSYLCKIFKDSTGTTINQYITAKRISLAKALLAEKHSVAETSSLCGFGDYSNFLKSFTRAVGISPKKYASFLRN